MRTRLIISALSIWVAATALAARAEERHLERLDRGECGDSRSTQPFNPDRNLMGIRTQGYWQGCWWSEEVPPSSCFMVRGMNYSRLAASSAFCTKLAAEHGVSAAIEKCRRETGFESVDVGIALSREFDPRLNEFKELHPWTKSNAPDVPGLVRTLKVASVADLQKQIFSLLAECKVVNYAMIMGHGVPGAISLENETVITTQLILNGLACGLSPGARVQVTSCTQACGNTAQLLKQGLTTIATHPSLAPLDRRATAFEGTKFLFNTDLGFSYPGKHLRSENDIAVEYRISGTDTAMDEKTPRECAPVSFVKRRTLGVPWREYHAIPLGSSEDARIANPF